MDGYAINTDHISRENFEVLLVSSSDKDLCKQQDTTLPVLWSHVVKDYIYAGDTNRSDSEFISTTTFASIEKRRQRAIQRHSQRGVVGACIITFIGRDGKVYVVYTTHTRRSAAANKLRSLCHRSAMSFLHQENHT